MVNETKEHLICRSKRGHEESSESQMKLSYRSTLMLALPVRVSRRTKVDVNNAIDSTFLNVSECGNFGA